jgi:hypothetical protein
MIRVTVELVSAITGKTEVLGVGTITNDGTGTKTSGNYTVSLSKRGGKSHWCTANLYDFPRRKLLAWDLLYRALRETVGYRNETCTAVPSSPSVKPGSVK